MGMSALTASTSLTLVLLMSLGMALAEPPLISDPKAIAFDSPHAAEGFELNYLTDDVGDELEAASVNGATSQNSRDWCECCDDVGSWRDNTLFFLGGEAFKTVGDTAIPPSPASGFANSAGLVGGFNSGLGLWEDSAVRGQIGASYGVFDLKGRDTISANSVEQQAFLTAGIYKRSDILNGDAISWGLVYDQLWCHQWGLLADELYVGQARGIWGYALNECHELGVWGAFRTTAENSTTVPGGSLRAMTQYNAFWRTNWEFGGQTMLYFGGNDPADIGSWLFGILGQAPLSDHTALYGNFTYAFPGSSSGVVGSNELEWNFGVGLVFFTGGKAFSRTVSGPKGLPLLPVANNGSFLITN